MRIGAILPHMLVFGGVRRYIELGNAFTSRGHSYTIFTPDGGPADWIDFTGNVKKLDTLTDVELDVAMCGSPELVEHLDRCTAAVKIFYLQLEGIDREDQIIRSGRYQIMVNSSGLARRVRRRYSIEPLNGIGGIDPERFRPVDRSRDGGPFRILCYGRLSRPRKGTRFVIDAARWMHRRGFGIELHLFDTVPPGAPDPRIGFDPGIPYRFYLNLPQTQMAPMYGAADAFVSAEHRAGWSNTAAEAAACGLPLVCTKSGTEDFAVHGRSALVIPLRLSLFIKRALVTLYRDRELAARLGPEARKAILKFTWNKVCVRMEHMFQDLLKSRE